MKKSNRLFRLILPVMTLLLASIACNSSAETTAEPPVVSAATDIPPVEDSSTDEETASGESPGDNIGFREQFESDVMNAIVNADYDAMKSYMLPGENFYIGGWQAGASSNTPDAAVQNFVDNGWMVGSVQFDPNRDISELLGGNPADFFSSGVNFIYGSGFGNDGMTEAIIVIDSTDEGVLYWSSILFATCGFQGECLPSEGGESPGDNIGFREQFELDVMNAIVNADFEAMKGYMLPGENFFIGGWQAGASTHTPDSAVQTFVDNGWMAGSIQFDPNRDISELLGSNPADFFSSGVNFIYGSGFGMDGSGEAIIIIDSTDDGVLYWSGILLALSGF